jgi:hypothetical protein
LESNHYRKACKRWSALPQLTDSLQALEAIRLLQCADLLRKVDLTLPATPSEPWYRKSVSLRQKGSIRWNPLQQGDHFVWVDPEPNSSFRGITLILYIVLLAGSLFFRTSLMALPWKIYLRHRDDYSNLRLALTASAVFDFVLLLLFAPFLILIIRAVLFAATHTFGERGVWIFPNLLVDNTFLGPFFPLYAWDDNPKETIGLKWRRFKNSMLADMGMLRRRRGRRKSRVLKRH